MATEENKQELSSGTICPDHLVTLHLDDPRDRTL